MKTAASTTALCFLLTLSGCSDSPRSDSGIRALERIENQHIRAITWKLETTERPVTIDETPFSISGNNLGALGIFLTDSLALELRGRHGWEFMPESSALREDGEKKRLERAATLEIRLSGGFAVLLGVEHDTRGEKTPFETTLAACAVEWTLRDRDTGAALRQGHCRADFFYTRTSEQPPHAQRSPKLPENEKPSPEKLGYAAARKIAADIALALSPTGREAPPMEPSPQNIAADILALLRDGAWLDAERGLSEKFSQPQSADADPAIAAEYLYLRGLLAECRSDDEAAALDYAAAHGAHPDGRFFRALKRVTK